MQKGRFEVSLSALATLNFGIAVLLSAFGPEVVRLEAQDKWEAIDPQVDKILEDNPGRLRANSHQGKYTALLSYDESLTLALSDDDRFAFRIDGNTGQIAAGYGTYTVKDSVVKLSLSKSQGSADWLSHELIYLPSMTEDFLVPKGYIHDFFLLHHEKLGYAKMRYLSKERALPKELAILHGLPRMAVKVTEKRSITVGQLFAVEVVLNRGVKHGVYRGMCFEAEGSTGGILTVVSVGNESCVARTAPSKEPESTIDIGAEFHTASWIPGIGNEKDREVGND